MTLLFMFLDEIFIFVELIQYFILNNFFESARRGQTKITSSITIFFFCHYYYELKTIIRAKKHVVKKKRNNEEDNGSRIRKKNILNTKTNRR